MRMVLLSVFIVIFLAPLIIILIIFFERFVFKNIVLLRIIIPVIVLVYICVGNGYIFSIIKQEKIPVYYPAEYANYFAETNIRESVATTLETYFPAAKGKFVYKLQQSEVISNDGFYIVLELKNVFANIVGQPRIGKDLKFKEFKFRTLEAGSVYNPYPEKADFVRKYIYAIVWFLIVLLKG